MLDAFVWKVIVLYVGCRCGRYGMDFKEAETAALKWMRKMKFVGAKLTQGGADGGVDVISKVAVAQVKAEARSTGRPAVQRIHGVAASRGLKALFFSTSGYTAQAAKWADDAGVALFVFDEYRRVRPFNVHGQRIVDGRIASSKHSVAAGGASFGAQPGIIGGIDVDLKFHAIECGSCGHDSPQAVGCQFCGETEPAEDPAVAARRRSVEGARARVGSIVSGPSAITGSDTFAAFLKAQPIERQLELMAEIDTADSGWQSRYAANVRDFERIKAEGLQSTNRSDPVWNPVWMWNDKVFHAVTQAFDAFEHFATASTPDLAVSYFDDGQRALDRAGNLAEASSADLEKRSRQMARNTSSSGFGCALSVLTASMVLLLVLLVAMV